jgi:membrane-bound metal-dependent hydrolase YbcI (DUF457 family)
MQGYTHAAAGILAGLILCETTNQTNLINIGVITSVSCIVSLIPDVDQQLSIIGKIFFPLSYVFDKIRDLFNFLQYKHKGYLKYFLFKILKLLRLTKKNKTQINGMLKKIKKRKSNIIKWLDNCFEHRGITHTLLIPTLIFICFALYKNIFVLATLAGYMSHIIIDAFNDRGVPLLFPFTWKFRFKVATITTGNWTEKLFCGLVWIGIGYMVWLLK